MRFPRSIRFSGNFSSGFMDTKMLVTVAFLTTIVVPAYILWRLGVVEVGMGRVGMFIHLHLVFTIFLAF